MEKVTNIYFNGSMTEMTVYKEDGTREPAKVLHGGVKVPVYVNDHVPNVFGFFVNRQTWQQLTDKPKSGFDSAEIGDPMRIK